MTLVRKSKYITRTIWYTYHFITSVMCSCNSREEEKKLCKHHISRQVIYSGALASSGNRKNKNTKMFTHLPSVGDAIKRWLLCEPEEI